ncbi:hypothetical protein [Bacillus sp. FJAT-27251]|uniref:hypothetical protein n=1 Tax=Bacillus sp. FJAT-27251 TaxID=1684142 RepID=UPI0006A7E4C3|nr:hypothetical protein [Bacillus sp. FJAT-27251]
MQNQYYLDFYSTALVPAMPYDSKFLPGPVTKRPASSHWLIALEGMPLPEGNLYTWKVSVFAANSDGTFNANKACFSSESFPRLDEAYKMAGLMKNEMRAQETIPADLEKIG